MSSPEILTDVDARGVATVTFNRPEVNNAYNGAFIQGVLKGLDDLGNVKGLRAVVIKGNGRHFQAGADLNWINSIRPQSEEVNRAASRATGEAIDRLNRCPVPVLALVQGGCFGGGTGIVAACDVVIAAENAIFSISEVRWGLQAAVIIPHLNDAIGMRQTRRYAITGERFGAEEARRIGLVHEVVPLDRLEARGAEIVAQILENAPAALATTKKHVLEHCWSGFDQATFDALVESHAASRQTAEAAEGLASFAEKRSAAWAPKKP